MTLQPHSLKFQTLLDPWQLERLHWTIEASLLASSPCICYLWVFSRTCWWRMMWEIGLWRWLLMLIKDGLLLEIMCGNVKGGWLQVEKWSRGDKWTWNKDCWKHENKGYVDLAIDFFTMLVELWTNLLEGIPMKNDCLTSCKLSKAHIIIIFIVAFAWKWRRENPLH